MKKLQVFIFLVLLSFLLVRCQEERVDSAGERLAKIYCTSCHLLPSPKDLNREIWVTEVLPQMAAFYGLYGNMSRADYLGSSQEAPFLADVYPESPLLDAAVWDTIFNYYVEQSPDRLGKPTSPPTVFELKQFQQKLIRDDSDEAYPALATSIAVDEGTGEVVVASLLAANGGQRRFLNQRVSTREDFVGIQPTLRPALTGRLSMGSLIPSDVPRGTLITDKDTLKQLLRPLDFLYWDGNQNGTQELIIAEYGNMTGRLSSYDGGQKTILSPTPGALRLRLADLDEDGYEDLLVLFAQGDERIEVWYSRPGKPERKLLHRFPPSFGSSDLQVADIDADGDLDLIHSCGDNYDYQPIPKPYHGVRVLLNDGRGDFSEAWFYHLDGAYGAEVDDFDGDGDQDIAAIAYFIPPDKRALNSFVYLEQTGPMEFKAQGFEKQPGLHYICLDKGDPDGDGDQDIVIGNFSGYLPDGMPNTRRSGKGEVVYVWLKNVGK
ncbi:FG-GAP repeat domain-containing protein [Neolewinella agarilytica]|uniref:FG-GAP repeat domain-containing protein n=1 Tax=Neolewinella agarilytica TaxID=478744 RepID=UPI0023574643|nr:VCBS repeat-containing protein [Neolewinella agarilytica]